MNRGKKARKGEKQKGGKKGQASDATPTSPTEEKGEDAFIPPPTEVCTNGQHFQLAWIIVDVQMYMYMYLHVINSQGVYYQLVLSLPSSSLSSSLPSAPLSLLLLLPPLSPSPHSLFPLPLPCPEW